mgnify:CR=1 FL=1
MSARKRPPIPVIVLLVVALAAGGWWWWSSTRPAASIDRLSGVAETRTYQVAATIAGRITEVKVAEGDAVTEGQVVATLDAAPLNLVVDQANAGLDAAKATLKQAQDDSASAAELAADTARVKQAEASVALAKTQVDNATIKAPHAGRVVTVTANAGQNAAPGKTLLTIADPAQVYLRVFVPETRLGAIKVGQAATVTTDAAKTLQGTVTFVATDAEFTPNNVETKDNRAKLVYEVRVSVTGADGVLLAGQPADVALS